MSQPLDRAFALEAVRVTEAAARAASGHIGRGDEYAVDEAAAIAMRKAFAFLPVSGTIVIGEGDPDEASVLFSGETVGCGGVAVDIALDPLEGRTLAAKALPNAIALLAIAEPESLVAVPEGYMDKIAIGPGYPEGIIDLDADPAENIAALARAKGVDDSEITVCILDRPRHAQIVEKVRAAGAAVKLIVDGDVAAILATTDPASGIDIYLGTGGAPEGVLAAAALRCVGGQMLARLNLRNEAARARARALGIADPARQYRLDDLVRGDVVFAATGVTDGSLLSGVKRTAGFIQTESLVMRASSGTVRKIRTRYRTDDGG